MNGAKFIPENAVTIRALRQYRPFTGQLAVFGHKLPGIGADITGDRLNVFPGYVGTAIPFAAIAAQTALKQRIAVNPVRAHAGSPWLFST